MMHPANDAPGSLDLQDTRDVDTLVLSAIFLFQNVEPLDEAGESRHVDCLPQLLKNLGSLLSRDTELARGETLPLDALTALL